MKTFSEIVYSLDEPEVVKNLTYIHIIIPMYNEGISIVDLLDRIDMNLNHSTVHRITLINDGCTDDTMDFLEDISENVKILKNEINSGKGKSLTKGFAQTTPNEMVITIDGDGEHLPEDLLKLCEPIINGKADVVIGSRFTDNRFLRIFNPKYHGSYAKNGKSLNFIRRFGNWMFSLGIWIATQKWIVDTQSGFRAFAPGVINSLDLKCDGFQIETEITMALIKKRYKIEHVTIQTGLGGRPSYMGILKDSIKNMFTIIRLLLPEKINRRLCELLPFLIRN